MNYSQMLLKALDSMVIGQTDSFEPIMLRVVSYLAGISPAHRPAGVFFLSGPTGTGKTHTVQSLARCLHNDPEKILRIDCGEYTREHEVAKLLGAPPGYIGHSETKPRITDEALRALTSDACKLQIILLDEIEKAATSFLRLWLGVFDHGKLMLDNNRQLDFSNAMIFMTSNLGQDRVQDEMKGGFGLSQSTNRPQDLEKLKKLAEFAAKKVLPPEFINRIDAWVNYKPLTKADISKIFDLEVRKFNLHLAERLGVEACSIEIKPKAKDLLIEKGFSERYGARNLKRVLEERVTYTVAEHIVQRQIAPGDVVVFSVKNGKIVDEVRDGTSQEAAA